MNTNEAATVTSYLTAKGMTRFRTSCPECGRKFAGKYYPADAEKALARHQAEAHA